MIWKSLAAVVGAIVLVIAINFIGDAVHNASTPVDVVAEGDAANTPLNETPTVSKADVGEGTTVAQTTEDTATQVKPTPRPPWAPITKRPTSRSPSKARRFRSRAPTRSRSRRRSR